MNLYTVTIVVVGKILCCEILFCNPPRPIAHNAYIHDGVYDADMTLDAIQISMVNV